MYALSSSLFHVAVRIRPSQIRSLIGAAACALGAALASPALAQDKAPSVRMVSQVFGDWLYRCQEVGKGAPLHAACEVAQEMIVHRDGKPVPVMTMAFIRDGQSRMHRVTILAPLGVVLKRGLSIAGDDGKPAAFSYDYCDQRGCWVADAKADTLVMALRRCKTGHIRLGLVNGRNVTLNFSLTGFAPGLAALDAGRPPEPGAGQTSEVTPDTPSAAGPPKPALN